MDDNGSGKEGNKYWFESKFYDGGLLQGTFASQGNMNAHFMNILENELKNI